MHCEQFISSNPFHRFIPAMHSRNPEVAFLKLLLENACQLSPFTFAQQSTSFIKRLVIQFFELISNVNSDYCIMLPDEVVLLKLFQFLALQLSKLELDHIRLPVFSSGRSSCCGSSVFFELLLFELPLLFFAVAVRLLFTEQCSGYGSPLSSCCLSRSSE